MSQDFPRVPYGLTVHGEEEIAAVTKVLRSSTQMGSHVQEMERRIAVLLAKKHGIMVNSGSSALYLGMEVLGLPKGSEVITPCLTFATTVASIVKNGLIPAFIDVEPGTYCIDASKIEEAITKRSRAVLVPNLIGNLPEWPKIAEIAKRHNLVVVEDSADTLGAIWDGRSSGRFSDITITSFYGSHVINCAGNGGMLCVNDDEHCRKAKLLRSWGRSSSLFVESEAIENRFNVTLEDIPYDAKFVFEEIGYNFEPSELGAAFGLVQLEKLQRNIEARIKNFDELRRFFASYEKWFILPKQRREVVTGWLAFPLTIREGAPFTRRDLQIFLEKRNIQTRVVFTGNILRQPGFRNIDCVRAKDGYPQADGVTRGGMLIACHHGMTDVMMAHVKESIEVFAERVGSVE